MKILKTIAVSILILFILSLSFNVYLLVEDTKKPSFNYLQSVTVFIEVRVEDGKWAGSGVVVKITEDYTYILTNKHVAPIEENGNIYVYNNGEYKKADVLKNTEWDEEDMSLIRVPGTLTNKKAVKGIRNPRVTNKVFMTGNHGAKHCIYREGVVSKLEIERMYVQLPVKGGDSGTGLIDKDGYLVGLVFALELDYAYFMGAPIILSPNHTMAIAMKGIQILIFLDGEI